jgi:hypothetical protein
MSDDVEVLCVDVVRHCMREYTVKWRQHARARLT